MNAKEIATRLSRTGKVTRSSGGWLTNCPCSKHKRGDRNPSLSIDEREGKLVWKCHAGGDQMDVWDAIVTKVPEVSDLNRDHPSQPDRYRDHPKPVPPSRLTDKGIAYLRAQGISDSTIEDFRIGWDDKHNGVAFPYYVDGKLQHVKVLRTEYTEKKDKWWQTPGGGKCYFNLDKIDPDLDIYITEGEKDCMSVSDAGYYNVVSVPNGAGMGKDGHPPYIASSIEKFSNAPRIILAVDNDPQGHALREDLAKIYGRDRCWFVDWPADCKDANDVLRQHGAEVLASCLKAARPYPIRAIQSASEYMDSVLELYHYGRSRGLGVGYPSIAPYYTVMPGELEVVTGIPGSGKSNWLDQVCMNLSEQYGTKHAVCSFENPMEQHLGNLAEKRARKSFVGHDGVRISEDELLSALAFINEHWTFIRFDDEDTPTIDQILQYARIAKMRYGIETLTVDPWNYVEHSRKKNQTETEYVSEVLSKLRRFGQNHGVHVWLVAHPPKLQKDKDGAINPPTGYDISGSANFFNKSDVLTVVHRNVTVNPTLVEIYFRKVKFRLTGQPGQVEMFFNLRTGCYEDPNKY